MDGSVGLVAFGGSQGWVQVSRMLLLYSYLCVIEDLVLPFTSSILRLQLSPSKVSSTIVYGGAGPRR